MTPPGRKALLVSFARVAAIIGVSFALGAGCRPRTFPWRPDVQEIHAKESLHDELRRNYGVTHDEFMAMLDDYSVIIIDARPKAEFEKGHLFVDRPPPYIPVLNIPPDDVFNQMDRLVLLTGQPLLIYCTSIDCDLGEELVFELERTQLGFERSYMKIYFPGWDNLLANKLPIATGPDTWTGFEPLAPPVDDAGGGSGR